MIAKIIVVLDDLQVNWVSIADSSIVGRNFPLKLEIHFDMTEFLSLSSQDPNIPLQCGDRFLFDPFHREKDTIDIDILVSSGGRGRGKDQSFIVLLTQKPAELRIAEKLEA